MPDFPIQLPAPSQPQIPGSFDLPSGPAMPPGQLPYGAAGLNAYQLALIGSPPDVPPFVGALSEWLQSLSGQSAYALWQAQPGNEDSTEQDFLGSMNGDSVEFTVSPTHIQWRVVGAPVWLDLLPLESLIGPASTVPGPPIELRTNSTHVQWRVVGAPSWIDLVTLAALTGAASTAAGPAVELQVGSTHVQWRVVGAPTWIDLIPIASLVGPASTVPGPPIEMQVSVTHIQWRVVGAGTWTNLVALSTLQGPPGSADASTTFIAGKLVEWAATQDLTLGNLGGGEAGVKVFKAITIADVQREGGSITKTKAVAETRITTSYAADTELTGVSLLPYTVYDFAFSLPLTVATTVGFKVRLVLPSLSNPSASVGIVIRETLATSGLSGDGANSIVLRSTNGISTAGITGWGRFRTGATGGTCYIEWAQVGTAGVGDAANPATLPIGSSITINQR